MSRVTRRAAHRDPRPVCALLLLATLLLAGACGPSDPVGDVKRQHEAGQYRESLLPLQILVENRPEDPEVHYLYGLALSASGEHGLAIWPLRKAMESEEWTVRAGLRLASAQLATGSFDSAIETASRVLEVEPDNLAALSLRAMARVHSRRDYEGALADVDRALEIDPDHVDVLAPRAVALLALERVEEAGAALEELELRHRDESLGLAGSPLYCTALASFAKEKQDFEAAGERYERCLEKFPAETVLVNDSIEFFDHIGRRDRSDEILRAALAAAPEARGYRQALVLRLRSSGAEEAAEALLREATESPDLERAAQGWADLATHFVELERWEEAAEAMSKAAEMAPAETPMLMFAYADVLILAERYDDALAVASRLEIPVQRALIEGRVHLEQGDPARALERFDEGLRLWPDNAAARYYAGLAAERVGDLDRAVEEHRYAVRIEPRATDAYLRLARIYAAQGNDERALSVLRHQPGGRPEEVEAALLRLSIEARRGRAQALPPALAPLLSRPENRGRAVAAVAGGVRERAGPAAAAAFVRDEELDRTRPENADALRALIDALAEAGEPEAAVAEARRALEAHPDAAVFHALLGDALERGAAPASEARAAYERALELDAEQPWALHGLAKHALEAGDAGTALAYAERAAAADPADAGAVRAQAQALVASGRSEEAERRLTAWVEEHPWDGETPLQLARLLRARGAEPDRTLALARRAARFGAGREAKALVEELGAPAPGAASSESLSRTD